MSSQATILIPDISGFTDFMSRTELDHASHIINELLELIVTSNTTGFHLSEIEGDALLFYKKGEPLSKSQLVQQCIQIFVNFHKQLKIIERDTVCQCGACQSATNLNLKFIIHQGIIKEFRVANFVTASGVDMIIAHRLLKNSVDSDEYILISKQCLDCITQNNEKDNLSWISLSDSYSSIGNVEYQFAILNDLKNDIPPAPEREQFVIVKGEDNLELEINKPIKEVYQHLINLDERVNWMAGVDKINRDMTSERIGMNHNCLFMGLTMENTTEFADFKENKATYVERVVISEMNLDVLDYYFLTALGENQTKLVFNLNWSKTQLPSEMKTGIISGIMTNLELFKGFCETQ